VALIRSATAWGACRDWTSAEKRPKAPARAVSNSPVLGAEALAPPVMVTTFPVHVEIANRRRSISLSLVLPDQRMYAKVLRQLVDEDVRAARNEGEMAALVPVMLKWTSLV